MMEATRLRGKQAEQQARHQARAALNAQVRHWLLSLGPSVVIEAAKPLKPKLKAGETLVSAVEKLRKQIGALRAEHQHTKTAAPTIAEMKAAAAEHVSKLAERGKPRLIIEHGKFELRFGTETFNPQPDTACILAWADPVSVLKQIEKQIDAMPKPTLALSAQAKSDKLAMIAVSLATLEFEEETWIEQSEVEGPAIVRRPYASPAAILGVIVSQRKAATSAA
jgi:hypothetical protein